MTANVETMFYVREKPWHSLGVEVQEALNSADALKMAGLDWEVKQRSIQVYGGAKIEDYKANVRSTNGRVLGVVSDRYQIMQNRNAFSFTGELIGGGVRCETTGSLQNGKEIWLLAKIPEREVVDDKVEPHPCFSNTHDGNGSIRVCMTPIRIVCNNTLNLALNSTKRQWATKYVGNIDEKMQEACMCPQFADVYMDELAVCANRPANTTITDEQLDKLLDEMFSVDDDDAERKKDSMKKAEDKLMICYFRPDIMKFFNTGWGVVNAMNDMISHSAPRRQASSYRENNWNRIMDGHKVLGHMAELVCAR